MERAVDGPVERPEGVEFEFDCELVVVVVEVAVELMREVNGRPETVAVDVFGAPPLAKLAEAEPLVRMEAL